LVDDAVLCENETMNRRTLLCLCFAVAIGSLSQRAYSQAYPAKAIRVLSTFNPGTVADGAMRLIAQKMSDSMKQPVVVEAVAGAGGVLAAQTLLRSLPDGYTIMHSAPTTLVATPFLFKTPPYDPLKDFTYLTHLADATTCLLVAASLPVNTVSELIEYARANPGKLAYGSNGIGGSYHLEMELLKLKQGLDILHIPYRAGSETLMAAATGQIAIAFAPAAAALAQARAGKVKILAVLSVKRFASMPELPSMGEQMPDYEKIPGGDEMVGPAGMPEPVVKRLHAEIVKALNQAEVQERLKQIGFVPVGNTPQEHAAQMRRDMAIMGKAIKAAQIKAE
jgi:tripartite-type tricarboxylate transporter receptor subunit TctC